MFGLVITNNINGMAILNGHGLEWNGHRLGLWIEERNSKDEIS